MRTLSLMYRLLILFQKCLCQFRYIHELIMGICNINSYYITSKQDKVQTIFTLNNTQNKRIFQQRLRQWCYSTLMKENLATWQWFMTARLINFRGHYSMRAYHFLLTMPPTSLLIYHNQRCSIFLQSFWTSASLTFIPDIFSPWRNIVQIKSNLRAIIYEK